MQKQLNPLLIQNDSRNYFYPLRLLTTIREYLIDLIHHRSNQAPLEIGPSKQVRDAYTRHSGKNISFLVNKLTRVLCYKTTGQIASTPRYNMWLSVVHRALVTLEHIPPL
jgi:hypothetical protein